MTATLPLNNVINVNVFTFPSGLVGINVANILLVSGDSFLVNPNSDVYRLYNSAYQVGVDFGTGTETYNQSLYVFGQTPNLLAAGGQLIIMPYLNSETLSSAVARAQGLFFFGHVISTSYGANSTWSALAAVIMAAQNQLLWLPSSTFSDVAGEFTTIETASQYNVRCLYNSISALNARLFSAASASRMASTNFTGSNAAITMNFKQLINMSPDPAITQTIANQCNSAGVDIYSSYGNVPSYISSGGNKYADQAANLAWFITALQVAGFNALQQALTKVPQTEPGMTQLKAAYQTVCDQAVANGYLAPGTWTNVDTFGNQTNFLNNIAQKGYYIYSAPISQQSVSARAARQAPLIQIAIKEAGAIQSSIINVYDNP